MQRAFHDVHAAVEIASFLVLGNNCGKSCWSKKRWNSRAAGANPFGKRSLRSQFQVYCFFEDHLLKQFVLAYIAANVTPNLSCRKQQTHTVSIHAHVVADCGEILCALARQRANQIFGNPAQAEAADHDCRAIRNIADGFIGIRNNFLHRGDCKGISTTETPEEWSKSIKREARKYSDLLEEKSDQRTKYICDRFYLFLSVSLCLRGEWFLSLCACSNASSSSRVPRFSRMCANSCSSFCRASAICVLFVSAMSRHIE